MELVLIECYNQIRGLEGWGGFICCISDLFTVFCLFICYLDDMPDKLHRPVQYCCLTFIAITTCLSSIYIKANNLIICGMNPKYFICNTGHIYGTYCIVNCSLYFSLQHTICECWDYFLIYSGCKNFFKTCD